MECQKCKLWDMAAKEAGKAGGMCEECFNKNNVHFRPIYEPNNIKKDNIERKMGNDEM
jgi:hypothetical protein